MKQVRSQAKSPPALRRALTIIAGAPLLIADGSAAPVAPTDQRFDRTLSGEAVAVLCDPTLFRISLRDKADETSLDTSYPIRTVVKVEDLIAHFPNHAGDEQYRGDLIRYVRCGPLVVRLQGEFLNTNIGGELGAIAPFAAVRIVADNRTLFPTDARHQVRLAECDLNNPRWGDCPAEYAVRIDGTYDPKNETMRFREWVLSGDIVDSRVKRSERRSSGPARLQMWWDRRNGRIEPR